MGNYFRKMEYCQDCGSKLRGRVDKKFCGDHCRSHYHNDLNKDQHYILKEVNGLLRKNAGILKRFNERGITQISYDILAATGFNFIFFTHQVTEVSGTIYNCCYNYAYQQVSKEIVLLTKVPCPLMSLQGKTELLIRKDGR